MRVVKSVLLGGACSIALAQGAAAQSFDVSGDFARVIAFGDSYSDTGNRIALSPVIPPVYLPGRISNGPVFTELLAGGLDSMLRPSTQSAFQINKDLFAGPMSTGNAATILGADDPRLIAFTNDLNADRGTSFTPQDIVDGALDEPLLTAALVGTMVPDDIYDLERTMGLGDGVFASSNLNFAVAGAESLRAVGAVPSTPQQVEFYFANGGTFERDDLITFLSGANDNRQLGSVDPVTLGRLVADVNIAVLDQIARQGSGTIAVIGLADLSLVPRGRNQPDFIQDIARTFSFTAIERQYSELERLAREHPDVNFVYVDLAALQNAIEADPASFGFANITDACIDGASLCDDPNSYLFIDSIHPSQPGHELLAALVAAHLQAGTAALGAYALDEMALESRRSATRGMFARLSQLPHQDAAFTPFVEALGSRFERDSDGDRPGYRADFTGLRLGAEGRLDNGLLAGAALAFSQGDLDHQSVDVEFQSFQFDLYGRYHIGAHFVDLTFGYEQIEYDDFERRLHVGPLINRGSTDGRSYSLAGRIGRSIALPNATLRPALKLAYYDTRVDGFTESGALARIDYESRSGQYLVGGLELLAEAQPTQSLRLFASLGYDVLLDGDAPDIDGQLINNTAKPFSQAAGDPDLEGLDLSLGLAAELGAGFIGTAQFDWLGQRDGSESARFTLGIAKPL